MSEQTETFQEIPDEPGAYFEWAYEQGQTDGLPVLPPSVERVEEMMSSVEGSPEDVVSQLEPRRGLATLRKVAANAVMAGCKPEYLPVLIAALKAVAKPEFNLNGIQATTNPVAPFLVVNGPIRKEVGLNDDRNVLGQGNRANATIGRALRLCLINIGGGIPGETDKAIHGMPGKYVFCSAEKEEATPWQPLHVERGFNREESVVTAVGAQATFNILPVSHDVDVNLQIIGNSMQSIGSNNTYLGGGNPLIILPPGHAEQMSQAGYSKSELKQKIYEHAAIPTERVPLDVEYSIQPEWIVEDGKLQVCERPEDLIVMVAGGPEPYHVTYLANFGDSTATSQAIAS